VRQVDLGLDFFFAAQKARGLGGRRRPFRPAAEVGPHFFRFVLLQRTGMGFLLRHTDERQRVEDGFALHFQFSGEIVDSNLTHPAFLFPVLCLSLHRSLTGSACCTRMFSNLFARAITYSVVSEAEPGGGSCSFSPA
jgi:hypothetical protein